MGLRKGQTNNPNGRAKGSKNKKTLEWESLGEAIRDEHTARFNSVLSSLPDEKFINAYLQVMEYFEPKLQRSESTVKQETTVKGLKFEDA